MVPVRYPLMLIGNRRGSSRFYVVDQRHQRPAANVGM